ncbi:hypothetical protein L596_016635 [Steinernema carpocapsae]|uniref:Uncharacterized protein n=1 Tax=Steinernema carpocapsae TaxID=34508 RepID=A0A4U5NIM1_STECR|nr:hypothetical protein L596_016635 [Steinernema carpocapsae]
MVYPEFVTENVGDSKKDWPDTSLAARWPDRRAPFLRGADDRSASLTHNAFLANELEKTPLRLVSERRAGAVWPVLF